MWRPISSASGLLAVPLNSLKRLSSLRLRIRLRSATGLPSFGLAASWAAPCWGVESLPESLPAPSRWAFDPLTGCLSSAVTVNVPASISDTLQAGWLWLDFGCFTVKLAGRLGFEPRQVPPKGTVLPLDDRPT